jgi:2-oxoglutarate dehydrogenase E2 component (dihydrolipoamide succinyltransferase)
MAVRVVMPQLGESVVEGTITKWLVKEGDTVTKDQPIVEVATDKADSEVPAPATGVVTKILAAEGAVVPTNSEIATIEAGATAGASAPAATPAKAPAPTPAPVAAAPSESSPDVAGQAGGPLSPAVKKAARELGVDVSQVAGTGERGRVTKQDVERAASARGGANGGAGAAMSAVSNAPAVSAPKTPATPSAPQVAQAPSGTSGVPVSPGAFRVPPYVEQPGDEIVPFSRRRRIIADHMVYSRHVAPHVMTIAEIDMQKTYQLREKHKVALKAEGVNLTFLAFVAAATVRALRENPLLNSRVLDNAFVKLKHINLGIAVETPEGLVVPVVRDADRLTVRGLAVAIDEVAQRARAGKITADDLAGATFTISNPGLKGNFVGAAVISQPNVGILRTGEMVKRPVVVEQDGQDMIAIHPVMFAALSYDHRIVDGVAANNFLYRVTELLEAGTFDV